MNVLVLTTPGFIALPLPLLISVELPLKMFAS
jgi:hypothetical protein